MKKFSIKRVLAPFLIVLGFASLLFIEYIIGEVVKYTFYGILNYPYYFLCFIFNIFVIVMIVKICFQSIKYKGKIWVTKNDGNYDDLDVLYSALNKLPFEQNIVKDLNGIVIENKAGKYVIKQIKGKGIVSGNIEDETWKIGKLTFNNPFNKENKNFILKSYGLIYNIYGVNICDIGQIIFKIEKDLLNVKNKKN